MSVVVTLTFKGRKTEVFKMDVQEGDDDEDIVDGVREHLDEKEIRKLVSVSITREYKETHDDTELDKYSEKGGESGCTII